VVTSKDVFSKRKEGDLDQAYTMAAELINNSEVGEWDIKAFAWCVIDLIKRDAKSGHLQNLSYYSQQLKNLEISSSDNILIDQRQYALKLCNPNGPDLLTARSLSKQGDHLESSFLYRKLLNNGDNSGEVQTGLAWEFYRLSKAMIEQDPPNFNGAKRHLNDYFKLNVEKPSLLHTCFLQLADKIAKEGKLNMGAFAKIWGLKYLRPDDYEPFRTDDGEMYPSLAERVIQHASKDAFLRNAKEELQYLLPFIAGCINKYPDNLWLKLSNARALMATGRNDDALLYALEVVKGKINDYWAWELLGDVHKLTSEKNALSCYCKALLCSKDINFVGKVKIKLAELLAKNSNYAQAKFEVEEVANYRIDNSQKIPEAAELLRGQSWYEGETAVISNQKFYVENSPVAEELIYRDLPWINAVLGDIFTIDGKPNKPKRKLYIHLATIPVEISIPESKVSINKKDSGLGLKVKGEYDNENRFQVYALEKRDVIDKWDIFNENIGVVDHVNEQKQLLHFIVNQNINGIIRYSELIDKFEEGDAIAVRVAKYTSKQGIRYKVLTSCRTTESIPESLVKSFQDNVREDKGMGFTSSGIFIPPPMVKAHNIKDGVYIAGKAILNYNKKRSEWGWKAFFISGVY